MECRRVGFAASIFHIRWRLAWNRVVSHACRFRRFTASACEFGAVEQPSYHYNDNFRISDGFGLLLILGLWTPLVRALVALLEILQIMMIGGDRGVTVSLETIGCALAMLGPGLWSVDARLFGWKRVEPPPRKINPNF